ncbi:pentapeptide repeat-containing protein [Pseudophaeobacter leonis]|uniref:pentapeptide repeat-containing protein n=1 Tax=Pseudophaeobacter leonis TaxID=1144477 RepID=UPI00137480FC|nr:pentapeptide repeat-containing protein [Pseudophaeobacter leonis]
MLGVTSASEGVNLGAGALIAALLGSPFLIWSTFLKHQTVRYQKEGHITDRISKAVEQLGVEKAVERIGRPVTIWTGKVERINYDEDRAQDFFNKPLTKLSPREWCQRWDERTEEVDEGYRITVSTWPDERTVIEWQGDGVKLKVNEAVGVESPWQVFKETAPNIEVRIGAILSLERIAQDSTRFDSGHDHVRAMEILCAYVRENVSTPLLEPEYDEEGPFTPRTDVQIAIDVIKRRSEEQIDIEASRKYRLDLRRCDFRGFNLAHGSFRGAILAQCRFEFSNLQFSDFSGARFDRSVLNYIDCAHSKFIGADMRRCRINKPEPVAGGHISSINMGELMGLSLIASNIPSVEYLGEKPVTFGTKDTILHWELNEHREKIVRKRRRRSDEGTEQSDTPFASWSPYDASDLSTGQLFAKFRSSLALTGWPYED